MNNSSPHYCPAAWLEVYIEADGRVENCCISHNELGHIDQDPAEDIIHNSKSIEIRKKMLAGEPVDGCAVCFKSPAKQTLRHDYIDWFKHYPADFFQDPNNFKLGYLDLRWRNTCDNACVYCGPACSSKWAAELNVQQPSVAPRLQKMRDLIDKRSHELEYLYLAGGEPLLIKENEWLLEKMLAENPKCKISVNTSLNNIGNRIFDLLVQFPNVRWIISGESTGRRYDYVRYGSDWTQYQSNLAKLRSIIPIGRMGSGHFITYHMVYCALTAHTIQQYTDAIRESDGFNHRIETFSIYYINGGRGGNLDPRNLPATCQQKNIQLLDDMIEYETLYPTNEHFTRSLESLKQIHLQPNPEPQDVFKELKKIDTRRNLNSMDIFPELYKEHNQ